MTNITTYEEKVVGTSFYKQDLTQFPLDNSKIPTCTLTAFIVPEPDNTHDNNAKKIEVVLPDNTRAHIGYLKHDGQLYRRTKVNTKTSIACEVTLKAYSVNKMNDSYSVEVTL